MDVLSCLHDYRHRVQCGGRGALRLSAKSCSKICLVKVYPKENPERAIKMYAMLDDQSNRSLATSEFFELYGICSSAFPYTLKTCAGMTEASGRRASGYQIEAANGGVNAN